MRQLALDLLDAALDEALLLARCVVLGVLFQVAVRTRLGDRRDDGRAFHRLESLQLGAQAFCALDGHRVFFHCHILARPGSAVQFAQCIYVQFVGLQQGQDRGLGTGDRRV